MYMFESNETRNWNHRSRIRLLTGLDSMEQSIIYICIFNRMNNRSTPFYFAHFALSKCIFSEKYERKESADSQTMQRRVKYTTYAEGKLVCRIISWCSTYYKHRMQFFTLTEWNERNGSAWLPFGKLFKLLLRIFLKSDLHTIRCIMSPYLPGGE